MPKKPPFINIIIAALLALLTVLSGFLGSVLSNELPQAVKPYLHLTLPFFGVATLAVIALTIWQMVRQSVIERDDTVPKSEHRKQLLEKQNHQRMLERVHAFWIKGVLEKSLYSAALIALGLKEQPDAVANPWHLVLKQPDQPDRTLPSSTRITQVYDDAGGELLILGEPGSGKTTLLLELARDLLVRAQKDEALPIPVVFNLASWTVKRQPLAEWLVDELNIKYQVPTVIGKIWVHSDQILPLLDGLDDMNSHARPTCVDEINAYRQKHMVPTVVCSRRVEYITQSRRIALRNAVVVQPLTTKQIDDYLSSAGKQLAAVHVALREDKELQELAKTPLMLSVLTLTYQGKTAKDLQMEGSLERRRRQIFATYVQRMIERRGTATDYSPRQTIYWLAWMARQMRHHSQMVFSFEWMPYDRLPMPRIFKLASILSSGLLIGLLIGLLFWLSFGLPLGLLVGWRSGMLLGLYAWLRLTPYNSWYKKGFNYLTDNSGFSVRGRGTLASLRGFPFAYVYIGMLDIEVPIVGVLIFGLFGLFLGLLFLVVQSVWLLSRIINTRSTDYISYALSKRTLSASIGYELLVGLFSGILFGLIAGPIGGLLTGLLVVLVGGGILDYLFYLPSNFILRFLLRQTGYMPFRHDRFLDYATDRILLRKVGGGYIFIHRLLLEYFASMDTATKSSGTAKQP